MKGGGETDTTVRTRTGGGGFFLAASFGGGGGGGLLPRAGRGCRRTRPGRRDRYPGAPVCAEALREFQSAVRHRESHRRGWHRRLRSGRQVAAGRLYAAGNHERLYDHTEPYTESSLRPGQGLRADFARCPGAFPAAHASLAAGEIGQGSARARPGKTRRTGLRLGRPRQLHPHGVRAVQGLERRERSPIFRTRAPDRHWSM